MTDFIINLPYHKRWWLPDRKHQLNSVMFGDELRLSIIEAYTHNEKQVVRMRMVNNWEDNVQLYQELANKRYKAEVRYEGKRESYRPVRRGRYGQGRIA
jgi:hypothetical protein